MGVQPTLEDLRELARRSRRAQAWGFLALAGTLALLPLTALVLVAAPGWHMFSIYGAAVAGGALMLVFAYAAGQERGAFRRVFARLQDERRAARTLTVQEPPAALAARR